MSDLLENFCSCLRVINSVCGLSRCLGWQRMKRWLGPPLNKYYILTLRLHWRNFAWYFKMLNILAPIFSRRNPGKLGLWVGRCVPMRPRGLREEGTPANALMFPRLYSLSSSDEICNALFLLLFHNSYSKKKFKSQSKSFIAWWFLPDKLCRCAWGYCYVKLSGHICSVGQGTQAGSCVFLRHGCGWRALP